MAFLIMAAGLAETPHLGAQSLLLGPAARRVKAKIELDPRLPSGSLRSSLLADAPAGETACSLTLPLCVIPAASPKPGSLISDSLTSAALSALETAYRGLVYAARLPAPLTLPEASFGAVAVTWELRSERTPLEVGLRPTHLTPFESAAVVCRSGVADGAASSLERDAFLCVGEAIAARLDAAESPRTRRAYAEALWWELGHPELADLKALTAVNDHPHRASVGRDELAESASTALLLEYLEHALGTQSPFGLVTGLLALSGQPRPANTARYVNEPDWFDVLRATLGDDASELAHRINAFAAARAQLGRSDGPLATLAWTGNLARIQPDWELRVSTLPRRVASRRPVLPLGMLAVRVEIDVPAQDLSLAIRVEWESPVPFTWSVAKLDADDREIGRVDFAFEQHATSAEKRLVALEGTRSLLILGTNLGGIDATHLLDPDHAPFEPHGCTIYVVRL